MDINNNEQYKQQQQQQQQQQIERNSLTIESYNLGNKSRSMPALGSSTRSLHADDHHDEDDEDEINYNEDEVDLSIVGKSASWACPREEINHPMYSSYSNGSIFDPPKYLPNPNSTLPPRGTFTRGPWHSNQPTLPKSPSLLFTVQFKSTTDTFSLLPTCPTDIHVGDFVKVEGDRGLDIGVVSEIYSEIMDISFTKKILCLATQEEIHYSLSKEKDEIAAVELCRALVARRGLSICIVDAEFQCDRKKLTFFFTSDRHTDFRELVRDLFATFKTRIWMQKIKAPVGHSHTPQLIRRPLPPTHPSPPYSLNLNSGGIAESQPLYNVPRSLQSRAFMGSGADYPNRPPQTESIHARMYPSTMIDPNHEYNLNSTSEFSQPPRNIVPLTSPAVPLQPLNVNNNGSNLNGNINNGTQQTNGRQSNSFLKPLVNRFKQLFHSPNQDEQVIDEYLHNGFGVSQNGYSSQYETQQQQQQSQLHSISPSTSGSYQSNFLYPADDIYRGTSQLSNNPLPLSLPLDSSSITLSSPTATQDTLSIFSASHINMSEMSVLPQTTSIASSISSSNNNNNNTNNINNNLNLNNNNMSNLNIISNPTVLSPTSSVSSLSKSQFNTTPTFQTSPHIDENLWLANVAAHQPSDQLISSSLYNQSINQRSQNNIPPPPISSPSYRSSSGDISDQTLGLEQYNITNSLAGLSISAEPFVYRGSTIHMGQT